MLCFVMIISSLKIWKVFGTSCKYPSSGQSCLGPAGLYSSFISIHQVAPNDLDLD